MEIVKGTAAVVPLLLNSVRVSLVRKGVIFL